MAIPMTSPTPGSTDARLSITVANGETSDWVIVPSGTSHVRVGVIPAGTAYVDSTANSIAEIINDTATGIKWINGDIAIPTETQAQGPIALRLVSVSGAATMNLSAVLL